MELAAANFSSRTKKILSLIKDQKANPPKSNSSVVASEGGTSGPIKIGLEEFNSASNWTSENRSKNFDNAQTSTAFPEEESSDYLKCDEYTFRNENENYEKKIQDINSSSGNFTGERGKNQYFTSKIYTSPKEQNECEDTFHQSNQCTTNETELSQWLLETNKTENRYPNTGRLLQEKEFFKPKIVPFNNVANTENNFQLPLIIVPPKEDVATLPIQSECDLPIIIEKKFPVSKDSDSQNVTQNYNNFVDEGKYYKINDCFNSSGGILEASSVENKLENCGTGLMELPQNGTPIQRKINILSHYILNKNGLLPQSNSKNQNGNDSGDNYINMANTENNFQLPVIVVLPKEAVATLPIESDFDLQIMTEKNFPASKYDESQNATQNCHFVDEGKYHDFNDYFNDSEEVSSAENTQEIHGTVQVELPQNFTHIREKNNVLPNYTLSKDELTSATFKPPSDMKNEIWSKLRDNGINDTSKYENPYQEPLPITSDIDVRGIRENPFVSKESPRAEDNNYFYNSDNSNFDSFVNDTCEKTDTSEFQDTLSETGSMAPSETEASPEIRTTNKRDVDSCEAKQYRTKITNCLTKIQVQKPTVPSYQGQYS